MINSTLVEIKEGNIPIIPFLCIMAEKLVLIDDNGNRLINYPPVNIKEGDRGYLLLEGYVLNQVGDEITLANPEAHTHFKLKLRENKEPIFYDEWDDFLKWCKESIETGEIFSKDELLIIKRKWNSPTKKE